ncbi:MAG: hypothetical protein JXP34_09860 [Planctomycetes bacterium]|nr:hypothetical protein [Planctomycetota bacterium]
MKIAIAVVAAAGLCVGSFLVYEVVALRGEIDSLREERAATPSPAPGGPADAAQIAAVEARLDGLERAARAPRPEPAAGETDLAPVQAQLAAHDEEIAALRKDLEGVRRFRGTLDEGADRILSALGQEPSTAEGEGGGLNRLAELGALWRKSPDELTPEEKAQRDQMAAQVRQRMTDFAVQGFDRTLDEKMSDPQKADIGLALTDERAALDDLRNQNLTAEEQEARRTQIRAQTDQRAEKTLTPQQYESWKTYRARTARGGMGGFFRGGRGGGGGGE